MIYLLKALHSLEDCLVDFENNLMLGRRCLVTLSGGL